MAETGPQAAEADGRPPRPARRAPRRTAMAEADGPVGAGSRTAGAGTTAPGAGTTTPGGAGTTTPAGAGTTTPAGAGTPAPAGAGTPAPAGGRAPAPADGGVPWLDPAEMAAWLAFLEVSHLLDRAIEQQLRRDAGLSHAQYEILSRLEAADGGRMRMGCLAEVAVVSRSGLTYQVTQLERAGLVRREKCPGDDRGVIAAVTDAGRLALRRAAPGHVALVRHYLIDALTPAQRAAVTEGLARARARLHP